jgi:hypothetical protein
MAGDLTFRFWALRLAVYGKMNFLMVSSGDIKSMPPPGAEQQRSE